MKTFFKLFLICIPILGFSQSNLLNAKKPDDITKTISVKDTDNFLDYDDVDEKDILWSKVVYEFIDVEQKLNFPLLYPTNDDVNYIERKSLWRALKEVIKDKLVLKENSSDSLPSDSLQIFFSDKFTQKLTKRQIYDLVWYKTFSRKLGKEVEGSINSNHIGGYNIKGVWYFDKKHSELRYRLLGIEPVTAAISDLVANVSNPDLNTASGLWIWYPSIREELDKYLASYRADREAGEKTADAYRAAVLRVLTSRHFIYLVEGDPVEGEAVVRELLTDWELASRLSYFLWSSMPDDELFATARKGALSDDRLRKEIDRMLTDEQINRFIDDFSRQWLQLHKVGMFPPDKKLYPTYDDWLETSMRNEPVEFFREILTKNLPIDQFLESDWTVVNARLCDFYGLPEPKTGDFQRVSLQPENKRGGLLTMGAVLGLTSDGTRHRPVHRGVWLSEVILNKTPPPPPANVDPIEPVPPEGDKVTVRKRLEVHATDANCASCHANIDPLGFAWDNYDAIGQWREREHIPKGKGENPVVDASGVMPGGRPFQNANEFKQLLLEDREKVARAFIEHLCTYALRRALSFDDEEELNAIQAEAEKSDYRVKDIIRAVAVSDLIKKR